MKRKSVTKDIQKMVNRIVKEFQPERVILFGSHARGEGGPNSDVDLLIVMPVEGSRRNKAIEIGVALHEGPLVPAAWSPAAGVEHTALRRLVGQNEISILLLAVLLAPRGVIGQE
jgi:predicted nucleotidyltransferase